DLQDVYQDTVIGVLARARSPGFDSCRSLRLVLAIARNKAIDLLLRRKHRINLDEDAILEVELYMSPIEAREVRELLLNFIATLPERQRIVAQCFIDNFEDFRQLDTYRRLAEAVCAITEITASVADVKNDWRYAREKIIAELQRRGHTYITV